MKLREYLWRAKRSYRGFAKLFMGSPMNMFRYIDRTQSPSSLTAWRIHIASGGRIRLIDLLSYRDMEKLEDLIASLREKKDATIPDGFLEEIEKMISDSRKEIDFGI